MVQMQQERRIARRVSYTSKQVAARVSSANFYGSFGLAWLRQPVLTLCWVFAVLLACDDSPAPRVEERREVDEASLEDERAATDDAGSQPPSVGTRPLFGSKPHKVNGELPLAPPESIISARQRKTFREKLEAARELLSDGKVVFPERMTMRQGEEELVKVRVSATGESSKEDIAGDSVVVEDIKISPIMVACLEGDPNEFRIRGQSGDVPESKPADTEWRACRRKTVTGSSTEWQWSVKPLVSGTRELRLAVETRLVINRDSFEGPGLPGISRTIHVEPDPLYVVEEFWKNNWKWILGVLFGSGLLAPFIKRGVKKLLSGGKGGRSAEPD